MEIEYDLTLEEFGAFARPIQEKKTEASSLRKSVRRQAPWIIIMVLVAVWMALNADNRRAMAIVGNGYLLLLGMLLGAVGLGSVLFVKKKIILVNNNRFRDEPRNRWLFEPHRMRIDPERLTVIFSVQQVQIDWAGICRIDATDKWIAFWTTTRSGHVVPRRAFRDQQHFEQFLALAHQYQQAAGQQTPKSTGIIAGLPPQSGAITRSDVP